ncbi:toxin secretion/phage lysis holin [Fontibacillus solani]|uniref:Toxin secretion/phage lysis holin n=1 Tax=Fontibacillus solani TaxID=1572857 RepID=A0A7W3XUG2_9BACL|nr:phage holin family protein [Fontibacillus solani]MBA9088579.1 toxin secretion/phage lysis holin [Fontibacillus solani]
MNINDIYLKISNFKLLANKDYSSFYTLSGVTGGILTYAFGGWSGLLELLIIVFAIDYVTGCLAALKTGKGLKSSIGFWGIIKKGLMLLLVFLGHRIDVALGLNFVMNGSIYFWLANESVSILENYGRLKIKTPPVFKKIFTIFKEKSENFEVDKDKIK